MAEIFLMKTIKLLLTIVCYSGSGLVFVDQSLEGAIIDALKINPILQQIILVLLILFWVIRILWFVWDHFYLESKERLKKLKE
jgi:hypothetical protein